MSVTFDVDRVKPAARRAPEGPLPRVFHRLVGRPLLVCTDVDASLLTRTGVHPLAAAVHEAFSNHRPLVLSPDAVWLTIAQGFAQHVGANAATLRHRFVRHRGVRTLPWRVMSLTTREDWEAAIEGLCHLVDREVEPGVAGLVRCDFSTSTLVTRIAGAVVLLDAFQRYFDYRLMPVCGIPQVTLLGTLDDWRKIEARAQALATYDLGWWIEWLAPVCRELRRTVEGRPDLDFWQSIYMPGEVYGGTTVTGWIGRLFPYVEGLQGFVRNPGLRAWRPDASFDGGRSASPTPKGARRKWLCRGVALESLPLGMSRVPVRISDIGGGPDLEVQLLAGFVGVMQTESSAVRPHIGWGVVEGADEPRYAVR